MRPLIQSVARRTILTAVFTFVLAASVAAAPQRGGGDHSGGGGHSGGGPRGHFNAGPHGRVDGPSGHFRGPRERVIIRGGLFDPFWWPYAPFGYGAPYLYGYPYWPYYYPGPVTGSVKTEITPKQTEVYVDGYYAGAADNFDGAFHRLHTSPGGHTVTLHLEGYRTVTENIYVRPDSTFKLKETMEKLAPGEVSAPVPRPTAPAGRANSPTPTPEGGSLPQR